MEPEKIARKGFGGSEGLKRACILHFNATIFPGLFKKNLAAPGEFLPEMLKKLDYERFVGYTSTGFESGG
jgi:hypothetical protein